VRWLIPVVLFLSPVVAWAQEQPIVRVDVSPPEVTVGEAAEVRVTVLVPTWFPRPPVFPSFEVANAITRLPPNSSYPTSERVGRDTWSGIVRNYRIYPLSAATYRLDSLTMNVSWANPGSDAAVAEITVPEIVVSGVVPAGAEGIDPYIAGSSLTLTREVDGDVEDLEAGDALVIRHIAELDGLPAIFLPPLLQAPDTQGMSVYADEPVLEDGEIARRVETVTLVFDAGGEFVLPGLDLDWWNFETGQIERATLPQFTIPVAGPPLAQETVDDVHLDWRAFVGITPAAVLVLVLAGLLLRRAWQWQRLRAERYKQSEAYSFKRLRAAAAKEEAAVFYSQLFRWLAHVNPTLGPRQFAGQFGDEALVSRIDALVRSLYADGVRDSSCKDILRSLSLARARFLARNDKRSGNQIPPLNPGAFRN
jgi:hypothetical protein